MLQHLASVSFKSETFPQNIFFFFCTGEGGISISREVRRTDLFGLWTNIVVDCLFLTIRHLSLPGAVSITDASNLLINWILFVFDDGSFANVARNLKPHTWPREITVPTHLVYVALWVTSFGSPRGTNCKLEHVTYSFPCSFHSCLSWRALLP